MGYSIYPYTPCRGCMFFMVIPLKNSKLKTFYPWRIPSSKPFTPEECQALKNFSLKPLYPWRIPSSKPFNPEEFQTQNTLPLKNSKLKTLYPWRIPSSKPFTPEEFQGSSTGGGVRILNGIAQYNTAVYIAIFHSSNYCKSWKHLTMDSCIE
jgi:hypothetical protein